MVSIFGQKNSFEIYCDAYLNTDDRFFTKFLVPQNLEWTHLTFQQLLPFINVAMKLLLWQNWRLHDSRMAGKKTRWQNILLIPLQVSKSIDLRVVGGFIYNLSLPLFFILCLIDFPFTIQRWYGIKNLEGGSLFNHNPPHVYFLSPPYVFEILFAKIYKNF